MSSIKDPQNKAHKLNYLFSYLNHPCNPRPRYYFYFKILSLFSRMFCHGSNLGFTSSKSPNPLWNPSQLSCSTMVPMWVPVDPIRGKVGRKYIFFKNDPWKIPWQRWKSYFSGQNLARLGTNVLFFNTLISLHLRAICKPCSNLQGRRNDETCKLRKNWSANVF
jgi:hypothetical protein